ncbi:MAG: YIP1 family protein [Pseudomonadota bacterium]
MSATTQPTGVLAAFARVFVDPRASVRAVLDSRPSEGRILAFGMFAALVLFSRQMATILMRPDLLANQTELVMQNLVSFLFFVPLAYYLMAVLGTALSKLFRGTGSWYEGRVAFFWAAFISAPVLLVTGILPMIATGLPHVVYVAIGQVGVFFFAWALAQTFAEAFSFTRTWLVLVVVCSPAIMIFVAYVLSANT